jgi:hypothetical protein
MSMKKIFFFILISYPVYSQEINSDYLQEPRVNKHFSFHFQQTIVSQTKPKFSEEYSGKIALWQMPKPNIR